MKCSKCSKDITIADCPGYTTLEQIKKEWDGTIYFLCAICRVPFETQHKDISFEELIPEMDVLTREGKTIFIKFTCHNCGARQTLDVPNEFTTGGMGCEECKKTSYPSKFGYALMMKIT